MSAKLTQSVKDPKPAVSMKTSGAAIKDFVYITVASLAFRTWKCALSDR